MTDEQARKAQLALIQKHLEDMEKEARAKHHLESVEAVRKYNLPYRVYLKQEYQENEIHINPFYPFPAVPLANRWTILQDFASWEEYMQFITKPTDQTTPEGKTIVTMDTSEVDRMKEEYEAPYRPCRMDTEEGRANWKKYFVKFLLPYEEDIKKWGCFDFYGTLNHTAEEVEEARQYYLSLIAECKAHPEEYELNPIYKKIEDYDLYNVGFHYMCNLFDDDIPKEIQAKEDALMERIHQDSRTRLDNSKEYIDKHNISIEGKN